MKVKQAVLYLASGVLILVSADLCAWADTGPHDAQLQVLGQAKLARAKVGDKVDLKVENAAATLSGSVPSIGLKERAGREVSKVQGIVTVTNNLQVADVGGGDDKLLDQIARSIRLYPFYTIFDNIEVSSHGAQVKLSGQVVQPWHKEDIGRIVALVPGVKEVENNIEVLPLSPFDNQIRWRIAMAIYRNPLLSSYAIRADPPIHIIVKNGNVTLTGIVHNPVDKAIAEREARFAATYFDLTNQLKVETAMAKASK